MSYDSSRAAKAKEILLSLAHVDNSRVDDFLSYAQRCNMDPLFHARRCTAFGASEIGALERHASRLNPLAGDSFFNTATDVVATKMLVKFPFPGNIFTNRGHNLEPAIRHAFHKRFGTTSNIDALKAIHQANITDTKLPWLKVSPDDVVEIGGKTYIPDYKMPSDASGDMADNYGWQLHAYKMAALEKAGIHVDGILLVQGVLPTDVGLSLSDWISQAADQKDRVSRLARVSGMMLSGVPGFDLKTEEVAYSPEKGERIKEVCAHYWNEYVVKGVTPESGPTEPVELSRVDRDILSRLQDELALVLVAKGAVTDEESRLKAELKGVLGRADRPVTNNTSLPQSLVKPTFTKNINWPALVAELDRSGVDVSDVNIAGTSFNVEALVAELEAKGVDVSDPRFIEIKLDIKKVASLAEENGIDATPFVVYEPRFGLGRDKASKARVSELTNEFTQQFEDWESSRMETDSTEQQPGLIAS